jgi:hydroxymethylpyrimidine pyrophosphatase-like HAD family hydrolase
MFREARLGIAVKNAAPVAKNAADVVLDVNNNQGAIAEIIRKLDKGELVL